MVHHCLLGDCAIEHPAQVVHDALSGLSGCAPLHNVLDGEEFGVHGFWRAISCQAPSVWLALLGDEVFKVGNADVCAHFQGGDERVESHTVSGVFRRFVRIDRVESRPFPA